MPPALREGISLSFGIEAWLVALAISLVFLRLPVVTWFGVLITAFFLVVPCFLQAQPLWRGLLTVAMFFPISLAATPLLAPRNFGFRDRMAFFFSWMGTHPIGRQKHSFAVVSLLHLVAATFILTVSLATAMALAPVGLWLPLRWLAGGIGMLSIAEMLSAAHDFLAALFGLRAPSVMRSPFLSTSVAEFWAKRWNILTSELILRPFCFAPFVRYGVALALCLAFLASAVGHLLVAYAALGRWKISLLCGAFFAVQPLLILAERALRVRHWPRAAARIWTLSTLAVTCPLFIEPAIQVAAPILVETNNLLLIAIGSLAFTLLLNLFFRSASLPFV